jgi:hypothetical protein
MKIVVKPGDQRNTAYTTLAHFPFQRSEKRRILKRRSEKRRILKRRSEKRRILKR